MRMLPQRLRTPHRARLEISSAQWPPADRSGDILEVRRHEDGGLTAILADVCGNGALASTQGKRVRGQMRAALAAFRSPGVLLSVLGDLLHPETPLDGFVAAIAIHVEGDGRTLHVATAGHVGPFLQRGGRVEVCLPVSSGPPLGIFAGIEYGAITRSLCPGDVVVCVTDGVSDPFASEQDQTGVEGLRAQIAALPDVGSVCRRLMWAASPLAADAAAFAVHIDESRSPHEEMADDDDHGLGKSHSSDQWADAVASPRGSDRPRNLQRLFGSWASSPRTLAFLGDTAGADGEFARG
ncbi:MAG TPA: PP2C family protein-serine/threonine phosphatase [Polyangia bacterium]